MGGVHIVLVGMTGSGKSTTGRKLAQQLGFRFVDSDEAITQRSGRTVREIFATDGEPTFRRIESSVLADLVSTHEPLVIATGGGAVLSAANRALCRSNATVIWLRAQPNTLVSRLSKSPRGHRPLLDGDLARQIQEMWETRYALYSEASHRVVDVDPLTFETVVNALRNCVAPKRIDVSLGDRGYPVLVGHGVSTQLPDLLPASARRVAVVTQKGIPVHVHPGRDNQVFTIGDGEQNKTLASIEALCRAFARWGMNRSDCVVAVGGGMVTDVAGFAAATYQRGICVVHVPTTLLGMVDAAIGGKTAVNIPEGKNLVGAFWQPSGVLCDLNHLATLPDREWRCGTGEMAKYHFLTGDDLAAMPLTDRVAACVRIKADVVGNDERESVSFDNTRGRALLNYGHTLGHALEIATEHALKHGEAIAIGLVYAARLAQCLGRIDADRVDYHIRVVESYGLDTRIPSGLSVDHLVALMGRDKKAINSLTFVLDGATGLEVVPNVAREPIQAALEQMA